ncbi:alpha/beta hydrolase [Bradyrhizobium sp. CCGUVB14]|uniref:alpha/beta fold hydrolase n=1 Tax=Bradyrhizobium sp. CCGUVB14 TaxID=2949628 RepID=UPI00281151AE|nr:alpha/beta hydrolase [Bradyrhizobium sp. CCGUVB14]
MSDDDQAECPFDPRLTRRRLMSLAAATTGAIGSTMLDLPALAEETTTVHSDQIEKLLPGFRRSRIRTDGAEINTLVKGEGAPLLLLHGHPQTVVCWHKVAPKLAERFTVVLTDIRGYGDSSKPDGGKDSINYSKREMARDQVEVMRALGFEHFYAAGHDRGGRVLHRLLLDHPAAVTKAVLLDIAPTATMYAKVTKDFAMRYMWWFFLSQPAPLPETLIGNNLDFYLQAHINKQNKTPGAIDPVALEEYRRCYTRETLHAVCEDYRAAAGIDLLHDAADSDKRIGCPLLVLWGEKGVVGSTYDVRATWREKAVDVRGESLPCGHYLPEEAPELVIDRLSGFFI